MIFVLTQILYLPRNLYTIGIQLFPIHHIKFPDGILVSDFPLEANVNLFITESDRLKLKNNILSILHFEPLEETVKV